jgi:hypothetical protein
MGDIVYIGIAVVFFILTLGLIKICDILSQEKS